MGGATRHNTSVKIRQRRILDYPDWRARPTTLVYEWLFFPLLNYHNVAELVGYVSLVKMRGERPRADGNLNALWINSQSSWNTAAGEISSDLPAALSSSPLLVTRSHEGDDAFPRRVAAYVPVVYVSRRGKIGKYIRRAISVQRNPRAGILGTISVLRGGDKTLNYYRNAYV